MGVITVILYALVVLAGLLLTGLILIQPSKGGGMGSAFGGVGESVLGGQAGSHLTKATVWLTAIFFVIALVLATLIGHGYRGKDDLSAISDEMHKAVAKETAAEPAAAEKPAKPAEKK
ncbi:MAG: preprotein translocase subunit SecG [Lentisphaeria bacterium]|nr:preprotein translocase subunit SecG [Lentisphaeria bacterium]